MSDAGRKATVSTSALMLGRAGLSKSPHSTGAILLAAGKAYEGAAALDFLSTAIDFAATGGEYGGSKLAFSALETQIGSAGLSYDMFSDISSGIIMKQAGRPGSGACGR